jgi:hypothetical protein
MKLVAPSLRVLLVACGALVALASADQQQQSPQPYYGGYPQQPPGQPSPYAPATDPNGGPAAQPTSGAPGQDYCFTLATDKTTTSICTVGFGGCERQRQGAVNDGQTTSACVPWSPVACFQLGGDPKPEQRFCAANLEDCELWRGLDQKKNGGQSDPCAWKQ